MVSLDRLFHRDMVLLLVATVGALANYALMLPVAPLWAAEGGASEALVGTITGAMMATTVLTQLSMGWIFRVATLRQMILIGSLLLAAATPFYIASTAVASLVLISGVRGVGFALVVVAGAALAAELAPAGKLATATGVYGVAAGLPNVVALPAGVWLAQTWGFTPMFITASVLAVLAVPLAFAISGGRSHAGSGSGSGHLPMRTWAKFLAPTAVFAATAVALGGATTFVPIAVPDPGVATLSLFSLSALMVLGRLLAGRIGDRVSAGRLLLPAAVLSAVGMLGVALTTGPEAGVLTVVAAAVFGLGFGAVQNDSLVTVMTRAGSKGLGSASTVWNIAYDGGVGIGAVLLGVVVAASSYTWGFVVLAVAIAALAPVAFRLRGASAASPGGAAGVIDGDR
ncbi:Predicted arabinose efflux permease, MFS family [Ruania alba]|uniref:Predicted arabinose efflux permease, MFS family n=1 Tax=Ruania alba TaxID=648782 RepID=A0A1H5LZ85_9MICO|nr:Predicted arabinose efflux permease, MFS family [Ruania alba]